MAYIDGFIIPVPTADRQGFLDHAHAIDKYFLDYGALRVVECWADDVPDGKVTDFRRSVAATVDESVVFSWIEWPDRATRDAGMKAINDNAEMTALPMPFDGKRMIFGGFAPMVDARTSGTTGYIDGFVSPVAPDKRDAYVALAEMGARKFLAHGALRSAENWGDDVPDGKLTDFRRAVQGTADELLVFSWLEWPDKAARDAGWAKLMSDPEMQPEAMPFDAKRMIYGGFVPVYEVSK
jgi:uncharacterized protein YbaA (DUF1428 family)